jgi:hypothetical protein
MTVESEQYSVKYQGTGVANDTFPIPFSFRHTEVLKVETIASDGTATIKTISTDYDVVQLASSIVSGVDDSATNVITSNSQRTEYGWIKYIPVTTDVIHIYREETPLQDYDYTDAVVIPAEQFEKSCDRITDSFTTQLARSNSDPSCFTAHNRKLTDVRTPVREDDLLTKGTLDDMGTTASLSIPVSGGSGDDGKLLVPTGLAPSTPTIDWASRLSLPSSKAVTSLHVLSPVSDYANTPFVEWTIPRWIEAPPNDGLRSVWSYGTGGNTPSEVEGETTTKNDEWRQFREMVTTPTAVENVDKVIRLNSTSWGPPNIPPLGSQVSYGYETIGAEPGKDANEASLDLRMLAADNQLAEVSPRMKVVSLTVSQYWDAGNIFGNNDGTKSDNEINHSHPSTNWSLTNVLKDDAGNLEMPQMVFMQCHTNAFTVAPTEYAGIIATPYTSYPVYDVGCDAWDDGAYMTDYSPTDGTSNNTIEGYTSMMNASRYPNTGDKFDDSNYLYWASAENMTISFLLVYNNSGGV